MAHLELVTDPEVRAQLAARDLSKPVGMLNMLKFRKRALYAEDSGQSPCSGEEAYARYAQAVAPILAPLGAQVLLTGAVWMIDRADEWDRVFVVRYDRGEHVLGLLANPDYARIVFHRTAALADSRLLMMDFDSSGLR